MKPDSNNNKIYFASDFHLGIPTYEASFKREKLLIRWLDQIKEDAEAIYLMGDIFDFWFEYKTVIQKGYVRLLGKLAEITDSGIPVHIFKGNHDIWAKDYLKKEVGIQLHDDTLLTDIYGKRFFLAHGDGLGPGDFGYKFMKKMFQNRFNQWLFRWLHPDLGSGMALFFSRKSRYANNTREEKYGFPPIEEEMMYSYSLTKLNEHPDIDYFIFGHRHMPTDIILKNNTRLIVLGDWLIHYSYAVFDGEQFELKVFEPAFEQNDGQ